MGAVKFSKKHNGPTPADDIAPQIITDCGNLTLDFKQLGLWASPPFLQTLGPWFPNEIQNSLSSEKRTLDHWATVFLLDNPHKAMVLSVSCASFSSTLFPPTQLSVNMLRYSTLWTASFDNECLWLTLLVKGVNDCLLDNCQISSLPHDCVA